MHKQRALRLCFIKVPRWVSSFNKDIKQVHLGPNEKEIKKCSVKIVLSIIIFQYHLWS